MFYYIIKSFEITNKNIKELINITNNCTTIYTTHNILFLTFSDKLSKYKSISFRNMSDLIIFLKY